MKLNLDFSLYKGTTQLKQWWKAVKEHLTQTQEAHNALDTALNNEVTARSDGDSDLQEQLDEHTERKAGSTVYSHVKLSNSVTSTSGTDSAIAATPVAVKAAYDKAVSGVNAAAAVQKNLDTETTNRQNVDKALQQNIDDEAAARQNADSTLQGNIDAEALTRATADTAFSGRITTVENKAHTHANKTVLDGISASDIAAWNGIKEQVSKTQLDEAIAAEAAERTESDNAIKAMLNAAKAYLEDMCFGFTDEFHRVYSAMGVTVYDGGIFGMMQGEIALDGGGFTEETTGNVDCGGFEPLTAEVSAVVDGGEY